MTILTGIKYALEELICRNSMEKKTLKIWRLFLPGIIFLLYSFPVLFKSFKTNLIESLRNSLGEYLFYICILIIVIIFGVIYYIFGFRNIFWRKIVMSLHDNIRINFINYFQTNKAIINSIKNLNDSELMSIFYKLIDDDESLRDKQNDVRLNGLILTGVIDAQLISLLFFVIYGFLCLEKKSSCYFYFLIASISLCLISELLKRKLIKKHFEYQNEQLIAIKTLHLEKLKNILICR
jgi:hypothetical protein